MSEQRSTPDGFMIKWLSLKNFRCHPDMEFGPFAKFNLIYGRNGSGKTSLLEAIQIGLTGCSFRAGTESALREEIAHLKNEDILINISTPHETFSSYQNGVMAPARTEILAKFYGIDALGTRARHLLNQLFSTHNILYSEQIVQFLASGTSDDLRKMVRELVLGREVLEIWQRIQAANKQVEDLYRDSTAQHAAICREVSALNEAVTKVRLSDTSHLQIEIEEFIERLPAALKRQQKWVSLDLDSRTLTAMSQLSVTVEEAVGHCTRLRDFWQFQWGLTSWPDFYVRFNEARQGLICIESELAAAENTLQGAQELFAEIEDKKQKKVYESRRVCERLDALGRTLPSLQQVVEWVPEVCASVQSGDLRDRLRESEIIFGRLQQAQAIMRKLPSSQEVYRLENELSALEKEKRKTSDWIEFRAKEINAIVRKIGDAGERHSKLLGKKKRVHMLLLNLHDTVRELCRLRPDDECPTCGRSWDSTAELEAAIEHRFSFLISELRTDSQDYPERSQEVTVLQERRAELEQEQTRDQNHLNIIESKAKELDQMLDKVYKSGLELKNLLNTIGILVPAVGREYNELSQWVERIAQEGLSDRMLKTQNSITQYNAEIETLWTGLRKEHFERDKVSLQKQISFVRENLAQYFEIPASYEPSEWRKLQEMAHQARQQLESQQRLLEAETQSLVSRQTTIEGRMKHVTKEVAGLKAQTLAAQDNVKQLAGAVEDVHALKLLGILDDAGKPDIDQLSDHAMELRGSLKGLTAAIREHLDAMNERGLLADQIQRKTLQKKEVEKELSFTKEIKTAFHRLESPESFETEVWKEYSDTISRLFKKLHWPPDFEAVRLEPKASGTELEVFDTRPRQQWVSSSKRLSSGQRAALAISVFWALNGRPDNVPKLILMDEPIQSVDDLNILNFLDALRWLVEIGSRQIFLTTANRRVAGLVRRKFSYLKNGFLEANLAREAEISRVEFYDSEGRSQRPAHQLSIA